MKPEELVRGDKYQSRIQLYDATGRSVVGRCMIEYLGPIEGYPWPAHEFKIAEGYGLADIRWVLSEYQLQNLVPGIE